METISQKEAIDRLSVLTEVQREVLALRCRPLSYKEIADERNVSYNTVKYHMGNIYDSLDVYSFFPERDEAPITSHMMTAVLIEFFCPLLDDPVLPPPPPEIDEPDPESISDEIMALVLQDEKGLMNPNETSKGRLSPPEDNVIIIPSGDHRPSRMQLYLRIGAILLVVLIVGIGIGFALFGTRDGEVNSDQVLEESSDTLVSTADSAPITQLFADDFNAGPRPEWITDRATWITANGKYTLSEVGEDWTDGITYVGDDSWSNYKISAEVDLRNQTLANRAAILVRVQDNENFLALMFHDNGRLHSHRADGAWYMVEDGEWREVSDTSYENYPKGEPFEVEIVVEGSLITVLVDGEEFNSWGQPDLPSSKGGIGFYINSRTIQNTATFDNLIVEELAS